MNLLCSGKKVWKSGRKISHHEPTHHEPTNLTSGLEINQALHKPGPWLNSDPLGEIHVSGFPQALEIMENHTKKFHAWRNHGI